MRYHVLSLLCVLQLGRASQADVAQPLLGNSLVTSPPPDGKCRARYGYQPPGTYRLLTCAGCYSYLFPHKHNELQEMGPSLVRLNMSVNPPEITAHLTPDVSNATLREAICATLDNDDECLRWQSCCHDAEACCDRQLAPPAAVGGGGVPEVGASCPPTWDGFACWDATTPGTTAYQSCPEFIYHAFPSELAGKTCTVNGTWYKEPKFGNEWTDYGTCINIENFKITIYIKLACNGASLLVLVPSLIIFLAYRSLRVQHRIRLHVNLFSSFILYAVINILWDTLVVYDRMSNNTTETRMYRNTPGCIILYVLTRYIRSSNFLWMFLEGLYLHRLIVKAFEPPKRLLPFYIVGWGFPWIPVVVYSALRAVYANESCWVKNFGAWEWLIYVPNFVSLAANLFFLGDILRILLTQLQCHPNEPSNYRRALKATFVLIPLFGLQLFVIIYRPPPDAPGSRVYECISAFITNSQGFFVAMIFCLLNGEVLSHLKRSCDRVRYTQVERNGRARLNSASVMTTEVYTRDIPPHSPNGTSPKSYFPLKTIDENGKKSPVSS